MRRSPTSSVATPSTPGLGVEHSLKQLAAELQTEVSKFSV
jgi:hypothetical protein